MTPAESTVIKALEEVILGKGRPIPKLSPETVLDHQLGLESLDFAELVIRLEEATGKDPFGARTTPQVRTISDLAALYEPPQ
ncbi:MAG: acyl carrier protein [Candidatus Acidiferrales bacterium]